MGTAVRKGEQSIIACKSINLSSISDDPNHIIGEMRLAGFLLQDIEGEPGHTRLTYVNSLDPRGWVPAWVTNWVASGQAKVPLSLQNLALELKEKYDKLSEEQRATAF